MGVGVCQLEDFMRCWRWKQGSRHVRQVLLQLNRFSPLLVLFVCLFFVFFFSICSLGWPRIPEHLASALFFAEILGLPNS